MWYFTDRTDAGRALAARMDVGHDQNVVVLGLPRGGVPVAYEVAKTLVAPLDVFTVRKLGIPHNEEFALGAIATGGLMAIDRGLIAHYQISQAALNAIIARERDELERRERLYRDDRPPLALAGKHVILVDDGLATGATMRAAIAAVRTRQPARVTVAVPVASPEAAAMVRREADEFVCVLVPPGLESVGRWYADFSPTTDGEVLDLLDRADAWTVPDRQPLTPRGERYA